MKTQLIRDQQKEERDDRNDDFLIPLPDPVRRHVVQIGVGPDHERFIEVVHCEVVRRDAPVPAAVPRGHREERDRNVTHEVRLRAGD